MPYLLILKKQQNLKLSSAANYRWRCDVPYLSSTGDVEMDFYILFCCKGCHEQFKVKEDLVQHSKTCHTDSDTNKYSKKETGMQQN